MFCPLCKAEYREGFTRCADCDVELVPAPGDESATGAPESITLLWQGEDPVLFSAVTSALRDAQIEFHETLGQDYDGFFSRLYPVRFLSSRCFEVRVFERDLPAAREILRELESVPPEEQSE